MKFFVSRQRYWDREEDEANVVEVAQGGLDYANPDMLGVKWSRLGEGKEYNDPKEAVEAAIVICEEWKKTEPTATVGMGATAGFTMSFDGDSYDNLRKRAQELYDKLPKCSECGGLLGKETYTHDLVMDDEKFCREYCADQNYNRHNDVSEEENEDE